MNKGYPSSRKTSDQKYQTLQPLGAGKHGADVLLRAMTPIAVINLVPEATSSGEKIDLAGHSVLVNDMIRFVAGPLMGTEVAVKAVDANSIYLHHKFAADITAADEFINLRSVTMTLGADGTISTSSGAIQFIKDAVLQQVIEDTVTPANNAPLPVKLTGVTGDVNITAGDLNVQTSHLGASFDSQRIGDGVTELGIIPVTKEAKVHDTDVLAALEESNKTKRITVSSFTAAQALAGASRVASLTVPVTTKAQELEIIYKNGENIAIYDAAAAGNLIGRVTQGGGKIPVDLAAGVQLHLESEGGDFSATDLVINLIGVDA